MFGFRTVRYRIILYRTSLLLNKYFPIILGGMTFPINCMKGKCVLKNSISPVLMVKGMIYGNTPEEQQ